MSSDPFGLRDLDPAILRARSGIKWERPDADYAAWIADMDFPVAPAILQRLHGLIDGQAFGYPNWGMPMERSPAAERFVARMAERYQWRPDVGRTHDIDDIIQGVRAAVYHLSNPGDAFVLHLPAYHPFLETSTSMGRPVVGVPAQRTTAGYEFDYDQLDAELHRNPAKLWVLCHPHNPLGRVFERDELERIAEIALRHDLVVISDEVHADIRFGDAGHVPFGALSDEVAARTVTLSSASKAFNLAGLRWAVVHAGYQPFDEILRALPDHYLGVPNRMAVEATLTAWSAGDSWLTAVLDVVDENRHLLASLLDRHFPRARYRPPDATYLAWVDLSACGLGGEPADTIRERGVEWSPGLAFGDGGAGHVRINLATSPAILTDMMAQAAGV